MRLFWVRKKKHLNPVFLENPPFRGPLLTGHFLAETRFTMGVLPYKLPLIVIVDP